MDLSFYKGKRVLVTGHTGFKGSWMSVALANAGAEVIGYSSCAKAAPRLFDLCGVRDQITHIRGDVRDRERLLAVFRAYTPEIVVHMAAQALVLESYRDPVGTYAANVMGTVHVCEAVRQTASVRSLLNVTTDKVYENREPARCCIESDPLDGYDPYSNSKSCAELVTRSYMRSFFPDGRVAVSTARAGNAIGGGDFAAQRIVPDCVRAALAGEAVLVRNPYSIRPYQHVLEPVFAYLMIAARQYEDGAYAGCYNVGPEERDCLQTGELVDLFAKHWGGGLRRIDGNGGNFREGTRLTLDCSRLRRVFGWRPRWDVETAVEKVVEWTRVWAGGGDVRAVMDRQIREYLAAKG